MKIVYHCADQVGSSMAGPGIRAVELARRLAAHHDVVFVAQGAAGLDGERFRTVEYGSAALRRECRGADVLVTQGFGFPLATALRFGGRLVLDLYDPVQLEQLAQFGPGATPENRISLAHVRARLRLLLARADHVLCASAPQRSLWLGWLGAVGRLGPAVLQDDPEARSLVAIVPFGLPAVPPRREGAPLRAAVGAGPDDRVALFWGGLWDWMDPALVVRAVALLTANRRDVRLAFVAGTRPGANQMRRAADETRAAVRALGLEDRVHFLDRWIPYAERGAWLLDADVAVTAHRPSLEAEYAFRTRLLDCLWARLPAACIRGDVLADEAEREGWGVCAEAGDAAGLASALSTILEPAVNARAREAAARAACRYDWSHSADTLLALLDGPARERQLPILGELTGGGFGPVAHAVGRKLLRRLRG